MNENVKKYLDFEFTKIRRLKKTDKSEVWLASDRAGQIVIFKIIHMTGLPYSAIKNLNNSLLPNIIYCTEGNKDTTVVEEYIQGDNLFDRLRRKEYLTPDEVRSIIIQLCDGLDLLHTEGIIHRDIKPSNLILQPGNIIRLIDFDAARVVKAAQNEDTHHLGTKGYAAPEQFGYGQTDGRSDIYSLGVTMIELLGSDYHGYLSDILSKCTEIDAKRRYQSVRQLKAAVINPRKSRPFKLIGFLIAALIISAVIYCYPFQNQNDSIINQSATIEVTNESLSVNDKNDKSTSLPSPQSDTFKFADIPISNNSQSDSASVPTHIYQMPQLPQVESPMINNQTSVVEQSPHREDNTGTNKVESLNYVKVEYYDNGERLNGWVDNFDYDIDNAGTITYVNETDWKTWQNSDNSLNIPNHFILQVRVINYSDEPFNNPHLEIIFDDNGRIERKLLNGSTIQPHQEMIFSVPLNQFTIRNPYIGRQSKTSVDLNFSGSGAEIRGTSTHYNFIFLPKGDS